MGQERCGRRRRSIVRHALHRPARGVSELDPGAEDAVDRAAGYAVFSSTSSKILTLASSNGFGVAVGEDGDETFLQLMEVGVGIGLGIKQFKAVFVFQSEQVFDDFLKQGWDFGGDADASAQHEGDGV